MLEWLVFPPITQEKRSRREALAHRSTHAAIYIKHRHGLHKHHSQMKTSKFWGTTRLIDVEDIWQAPLYSACRMHLKKDAW